MLAAASAAQAAAPTIEPGQWALKSRDNPAENRSICVRNPQALVQLRHGAAVCSRFVISSEANELTVHYTCPGNGHGRTTIRTHSGRALEVDSQGVIDRQPFAIALQGRRVGECARTN